VRAAVEMALKEIKSAGRASGKAGPPGSTHSRVDALPPAGL